MRNQRVCMLSPYRCIHFIEIHQHSHTHLLTYFHTFHLHNMRRYVYVNKFCYTHTHIRLVLSWYCCWECWWQRWCCCYWFQYLHLHLFCDGNAILCKIFIPHHLQRQIDLISLLWEFYQCKNRVTTIPYTLQHVCVAYKYSRCRSHRSENSIPQKHTHRPMCRRKFHYETIEKEMPPKPFLFIKVEFAFCFSVLLLVRSIFLRLIKYFKTTIYCCYILHISLAAPSPTTVPALYEWC